MLRERATGRRVALGFRNLVGRGALAHIRVEAPTVSAEHATVYYSEGWWKLRDLGSRNGTSVGARLLEPGSSVVLGVRQAIVFGDAHSEIWELEDERPPGPGALSGSGHRSHSEDSTLWLPSDDAPLVSVTHRQGDWVYEDGHSARRVEHGEIVEVEGGSWRLELPQWEVGQPASDASTAVKGGTAQVKLSFLVSSDLEHIRLLIEWQGRKYDLGSRAHNLALLELARARSQEASKGVPSGEAGWTYSETLRQRLRLDRQSLNLQLWRASQSAKKLGLPAEVLIERRLDAGQLRIATEALDIRSS